MIKPNSTKYKCPKCSYTKLVTPKSDLINFAEFSSICPKCNTKMEKVSLEIMDTLVSSIKF